MIGNSNWRIFAEYHIRHKLSIFSYCYTNILNLLRNRGKITVSKFQHLSDIRECSLMVELCYGGKYFL